MDCGYYRCTFISGSNLDMDSPVVADVVQLIIEEGARVTHQVGELRFTYEHGQLHS